MQLEESAKWRSLNHLSAKAAGAVFQADAMIDDHRQLLEQVTELAHRANLPGQYLDQLTQCIRAMIDGCERGREGARKAHIDAQAMLVTFEIQFWKN